MLIKYTRPNNITCHISLGKNDKGEFPTKAVTFIPGINTVEKKDWEALKKDAVIRHHLDNDIFIEIKDDAEKNAKPGLLDFEEGKACVLVSQTWDEKLLRAWLAEDKRGSVVDAIRKQLEDLNKQDKSDEKETK